MPAILLDTHAAIWSLEDKLPRTAARLVSGAAERGELLISPISAWEIGVLVARGRLRLDRSAADYVRFLFGRPGVNAAAISATIALEAASLPSSLRGDPADRILVATAAAYGAQLVTRDRAIHEYARVTKAIRCVEC
jgi:PIN domain nuclease of toxin-antitoxin system